MHRTQSSLNVWSVSTTSLMALKPSLKIMISQLPWIPVLLIQKNKVKRTSDTSIDRTERRLYRYRTNEAFESGKCDAVLLEHSDLPTRQDALLSRGFPGSPYTNRAVKVLLRRCLIGREPTEEGRLVLDCTNPDVTAVGMYARKQS
jgi:hypothetical protein